MTPEQRARDAAQLETLIAEALAAVAANDLQARADAMVALTDYQADTTDTALIRRAEDARVAMVNTTMTAALKTLGEMAARLDPLGATLTDCARIAKEGKANLLFPRVAASADHMLQLVKELQSTAEKLKTTVDNVKVLGDVPDAIKAVVAALEALKAKTKAA